MHAGERAGRPPNRRPAVAGGVAQWQDTRL
jgi:hypothetical protein